MMMNGELAGFTIPRLGMGTMALAIEGRPDRDTAIRTIHAGLDAGVRYLDTAWSYYLPSKPGTGTAEDLGTVKSWCVMRSLRGMAPEMQCSSPPKPDIAVLAKTAAATDGTHAVGADESRPQSQRLQAEGSRYGWIADSRPETMIRDAKESALHLGVDTLDLLYSHGPDPAVPYEDQCGA